MSQLHCVLESRVALVCVFLLCFVTHDCAGLRVRIVFCNSGVWWFAYSNCVLQRTKTKKDTHTHTYKHKNRKTHTHTNTRYLFIRYIVKWISLAGTPPK